MEKCQTVNVRPPTYLFLFLPHLLEVLEDLHLVGAQLAEEA